MEEYKDLFGEDIKEKKEKPVTYVGFVWDHSGSMHGSEELARTNFNEQLDTLKKDSDKIDYNITIIEFDNVIREIVVNKPINLVDNIKEYWVGGTTALYDSVGVCISKIKLQMEDDNRKDKAALIIVMTDGMENASIEYNNESIRALIKEMDSKDDWTFVFMGAGIDKEQATDMGFGDANTISFDKLDDSYRKATKDQSTSLYSYSDMRLRGKTKTTSFYSDNSTKEEEDEG